MMRHRRRARLKFCGRKGLLPNDAQELRAELHRLCDDARLEDVVRIHIRTCFTELVTHPGIYVHQPRINGVPLTWEGGDHRHVHMLLYSENMSAWRLHSRLTAPRELLDDSTSTEGQPAMVAIDPRRVLERILSNAHREPATIPSNVPPRANVSTPAPIAPAPQVPVTPAEPAHEQHRRTVATFVEDERCVDDFLRMSMEKADDQGNISTGTCVEILRAHFGFPNNIPYRDETRRAEYNMPYQVLTHLRTNGVLEPGPRGYCRIPEATRARLHNSVSDTPAAIPVEPGGHDAMTAPATAKRVEVAIQDPLSLLQQVAELSALVKQIPTKRAKMKELIASRAKIHEQVDALLKQSDAATQQIALIEAELSTHADAEKLLAEIGRMATVKGG